MPAKDILRIGKHALLFRVGDESRLQDRIRDRFHLREGGHKGRDVRVVGSEDELAGRDAVGEEAADLVVEDGAGAVVPESLGGISGGVEGFGEGRGRTEDWVVVCGREVGG